MLSVLFFSLKKSTAPEGRDCWKNQAGRHELGGGWLSLPLSRLTSLNIGCTRHSQASLVSPLAAPSVLSVAPLRDLALGHAISPWFFYCHIGCLVNLSFLILTFPPTTQKSPFTLNSMLLLRAWVQGEWAGTPVSWRPERLSVSGIHGHFLTVFRPFCMMIP